MPKFLHRSEIVIIQYYFYVKALIYINGDKMIWIKNQDKYSDKLKLIFKTTLTICSIVFAVKFSPQCRDGIINGLSLCMTVLIPSLFVFMVIAQYVANDKVTDLFGRLFSPITTKLLKLPKESSTVLLLSLIGGYPIGARCVATLFDNRLINEEQAKKLSLIAVSSGPGFVLNYLGSALLENTKAGIILFISQIIAFFTVAVLIGRTYKVTNESTKAYKKRYNSGIVEAVESGTKATANMCAMVIAFSALISVFDFLLSDYPVVCDALACFLEVTTACNRICNKYPLYIISFVTGFSGLCVHFQIFSAVKEIRINKFAFFMWRIIQGITASIATYILLIIYPLTDEVFSTVEATHHSNAAPLWGCCALVLTAVCFLNSLSKTKLNRR